MVNILWLCLIPLVWVLITHFAFKTRITIKEAILQGGIAAVLIAFVYGCFVWSNTTDHQILNGHVTSKAQVEVSCEHSYSCNCRTVCSGSGKSRTCRTVCDTCYEHSNDWDWDVRSTVGTFTINRIDRRGSNEPPRFTAVKIGEPAATTSHYTNWVKASPKSLFNMELAEQEAQTKAALIPKYPTTYDYYRVNHTLLVGGAQVPNAAAWDENIDLELRTLGAMKQVNILVVFVNGQTREYAQTLERAWMGGKKNDVIVVLGVTGTTIDWAESFTFGKTAGNGLLAVNLRDDLQKLGSTVDADKGTEIITSHVQTLFKRKNMADYEYLREEGGPTATQIGWLVGVLFVLLIVSSVLLWKYDVFQKGVRRYRSAYTRW